LTLTNTDPLDTPLTRAAGVEVPILCGAMYPCSNPELVAAVSEAGGLGIVQPLSLEYVHGLELRTGLGRIRELTKRPIGLNVIVESSLSRVYGQRMSRYLEVALEEGIRFFVTALGNPRWVVERVHAQGGVVYHDVVERRWARKALDAGADGLICVNDRAGGHAGPKDPKTLFRELGDLEVPRVLAGGVGDEKAFVEALALGYDGVQMGTRFIATYECTAHPDYKQAIVSARAEDVVLTERVTGVPLAVIRTPYLERMGTRAGPLARWMLRGRRTKHLMRALYTLSSARRLRRASLRGGSSRDLWQAGRSVAGIDRVEAAGDVVRRFAAAARVSTGGAGAGGDRTDVT
jgi:nitronate monooxygenase